MALIDEFTVITEEYDNKLYNIFKRVIDESIMESKKSNLNPIEMYVYVNEKLESAYVQLALAMGIISRNSDYMPPYDVPARVTPPISENLLEKVCACMEKLIEEARETIKLEAEEVLQSKTLEELQERYSKLSSILSIQSISESPYIFENLELTDKKTSGQTDEHSYYKR